MADWIDSKRFAKRWPFAGAVFAIAASALALLKLPPSVPWQAQIFSLSLLDSLWMEFFEGRIRAVGFSSKRWHRLIVHQAIILPCLCAYFLAGKSAAYLATGLFLALQIPLVALRSKVPAQQEVEEAPSRATRIVAGTIFFAITAAGAVLSWKMKQPAWVRVSLISGAIYFGLSVYRRARRQQDSEPEIDGSAKTFSGPFASGTAEAETYERRMKFSANAFLICMSVAALDLIFRNEFYGFVLPGVCFVLSILWGNSVRMRQRAFAPLPGDKSADRNRRIKNPFPDGTAEAASYQYRQMVWAQYLFISIALAVADLVFRRDFYGFFLPAVYLCIWFAWIGSVRERQRRALREKDDLTCEEA